MSYLRLWFLISVLLAPGFLAHAQVREIDMTKRADRIGSKRFSGNLWEGGSTSRFQDNVISIDKWQSRFSSLGQRRANISMQGKNMETITPQTIEMNQIRFQRNTQFNDRDVATDRPSRFSTEQTSSRFQGSSQSFMTGPQHQAIQEMREQEISMRDINRFQFRRSRQEDPLTRQERIVADPQVETRQNSGQPRGR